MWLDTEAFIPATEQWQTYFEKDRT
jgi:hypothetical protein